MYLIVWKYEVAAEHEEAFRTAYGPDGNWARLFARHDGFLGTELITTDEPRRYLTIDRWENEGAFAAFMDQSRGEYEQLDEMLEELTVSEQLTGRGLAADWPNLAS